MGRKGKKRSYTLPMIAALAGLLVTLAVLQYGWLGEISVAERQTMETTLQNRMVDLQEDFAREVQRVYAISEIGPGAVRNERWRMLAERYNFWRSSTAYPGLMKALFIAPVDEDKRLSLRQFDATSADAAVREWPADLATLRDRFEPLQLSARRAAQVKAERARKEEAEQKAVRDLRQQGEQSGEVEERRNAERAAQVEFKTQTLLAIARSKRDESGRVREAGQWPVTFIERGYIDEDIPATVRFIIELNTQNKGSGRGPGGERFEFSSGFRNVALIITTLDLDYITGTVIPSLAQRHFAENGVGDYEVKVAKSEVRSDEGAAVKREGEGFINVKFRTAEAPPGSDRAFRLFTLSLNTDEARRGPRWQVLISHRAGSLDAAVAQLRRRNLIVSFGILFLLAASVVIIIVNSRRAQALAQNQIEFVAGVSHEFRTPLAVIHAISENLADGLITDHREIEQCGLVIRDDVRRLAGMVEQVLELAGAYRGKGLYQPRPVDLSGLIDQALAKSNPGSEWRIEKEIPPDLPAVLADPSALGSALRNIIDNAVKYGGGEHWIGIKAGTVPNGQAPKVRIAIEDKGIGIAAADLPHIFEPFYRGGEVRGAQIHGNGLGLSLVKNIIEAQGGTIRVASVPGQGSCFTLDLPTVGSEK